MNNVNKVLPVMMAAVYLCIINCWFTYLRELGCFHFHKLANFAAVMNNMMTYIYVGFIWLSVTCWFLYRDCLLELFQQIEKCCLQ